MVPGITLPSVNLQALAHYIMNHWDLTVVPAIVIGSSSALKFKTVGSTLGVIKGIPVAATTGAEYTLTAVTGYTLTSLAKEEHTRFLIVQEAINTFKVVQGPVKSTDSDNANYSTAANLQLPAVPADTVVYGDILVTTTSAVFVPGTTALTTVGAFRDLQWVDSGPMAFDLSGIA